MRPGTYAVYEGGYGWADYRLSLAMRSADNDAIGVMWPVADNDNYYRFSWDTQRSELPAAGKEPARSVPAAGR